MKRGPNRKPNISDSGARKRLALERYYRGKRPEPPVVLTVAPVLPEQAWAAKVLQPAVAECLRIQRDYELPPHLGGQWYRSER